MPGHYVYRYCPVCRTEIRDLVVQSNVSSHYEKRPGRCPSCEFRTVQKPLLERARRRA